jgi:hypothetical protein
MRVRDHIALSTAGTGLLSPRLGRRVFGFWAASIIIDVDHYLWFCLRHHRLNPLAAARLFDEAEPPQHAATRLLHQPLTLLTLALFGANRRGARLVVLGMALHTALDAYHERRMDKARAAALQRDDYTCQGCGTLAPGLGAHLWQQPRLLPSYGPQNHVTLCSACHHAAHLRRPRAAPGDAIPRPDIVRPVRIRISIPA